MSGHWLAVTLDLRFSAPLSVGEESPESVRSRAERIQHPGSSDRVPDIEVAHGPDGPILRGTSVMGSLRAHLDRYAVSGCSLWERSISSTSEATVQAREATFADAVAGALPEEVARAEDSTDEKSVWKRVTRPSAVRILSCDLKNAVVCDGRERTAISRSRAASELHKQFQRQELEAGVVARLVIRLDSNLVMSVGQASFDEVADGFIYALSQWEPQLGGQTSLGYGKARVEGLRYGPVDLSSQEGLREFFEASNTLEVYERAAAESAVPQRLPSWLTPLHDAEAMFLSVEFRLGNSLLISPSVGEEDGHSVQTTLMHGAQFMIPASAWKGVLRGRAEYVLRSAGVPACESSTRTCGTCPACLIFGHATDAAGVSGARSLLAFSDSVFDADLQTRIHNAVDRFSGGAADGLLFTHRVAVAPATIPLQITSRATPPLWAGPLIRMVLLDIHDGLIGIGARTTRGAGRLLLSEDPDVSDWSDALATLRQEFGPSEGEAA